MENNLSATQTATRYAKLIREAENRVAAIDKLQENLYEDKVAGDINLDFFTRMSTRYAEEQNQLLADIAQMEAELQAAQRTQHDLTAWVERVKECITIDSLTRQIVVGLIDRIEVTQTYTEDGQAEIMLNISYKFGAPESPKRK